MEKFSTLDLSAHFNVTRDNEPLEPGLPPPWLPEIAPAIQSLPGGTQTFWGVPFDLGPAESNIPCWLLLGWEQSGRFANRLYSIPLSGTASFVVITHFCNASPDPDRPDVGVGFATRPGEHLADYYTDADVPGSARVLALGTSHLRLLRILTDPDSKITQVEIAAPTVVAPVVAAITAELPQE